LKKKNVVNKKSIIGFQKKETARVEFSLFCPPTKALRISLDIRNPEKFRTSYIRLDLIRNASLRFKNELNSTLILSAFPPARAGLDHF
jgi:hypothetical protein